MRAMVMVLVLAAATPAAADPEKPWTANLEVAGRGGLWGAGVERELGDRYYAGGLGSFAFLRGDHVYVAAAYGGLNILGTRHVWRADLGMTLAHVRTPSPVPEWDGYDRTGVSAVLASAYEYRGRLRWRAGGMLTVGKGGIAPWLTVSVGLPF